jgi:hypothetical protein
VTTTKLVFLHVPRTGGTTLHETFSAAFQPADCCPDRFSTLDRIPPARLARYRLFSGHYRFDQLAFIPEPRFLLTILRDPRARILSLYRFWRRHRPEAIEIHDMVGPRIARARGLLDFLHSEEPIVMDAIDNTMACQIMGDARPLGGGRFGTREEGSRHSLVPAAIVAGACEALLTFDCVGFTETLDAAYRQTAQVLHLPLAPLPRLNHRDMVDTMTEAVEDEPVTPAIMARLMRLTWLDAQVLRFAREDPRIRRA